MKKEGKRIFMLRKGWNKIVVMAIVVMFIGSGMATIVIADGNANKTEAQSSEGGKGNIGSLSSNSITIDNKYHRLSSGKELYNKLKTPFNSGNPEEFHYTYVGKDGLMIEAGLGQYGDGDWISYDLDFPDAPHVVTSAQYYGEPKISCPVDHTADGFYLHMIDYNGNSVSNAWVFWIAIYPYEYDDPNSDLMIEAGLGQYGDGDWISYDLDFPDAPHVVTSAQYYGEPKISCPVDHTADGFYLHMIDYNGNSVSNAWVFWIAIYPYEYSSSQYTITFYTDPTNGGTITFDGTTYSNGQSTQKQAGSYSIHANPATNYVFDHWSTTGGVSVSDPYSQSTTATVSGDGTLKAWFNYNPPQYTITFYTDPTNGGTITFDGTTYSNGQSTQKQAGSYSIHANPATNYVFDHWSTTGGVSVSDPYSQSTTATVSGDGTLKAWFNYNPPQANWTVIAYLCGDGNLGSWCQSCLNYMDDVGSQNGIEIIALIDKSSDGDSRAYHVLPNSQVNIPLSDIHSGWSDEVNMGDPNTLIYFAQYCVDNYPANHYLIIPQNHGGSWKGCCLDDGYPAGSDHLSLSDLKTAFSTISSYIGRKVDVVFFNDCLMNAIEVVYQLQPYVDFQAGSETISYIFTCDNEYVSILQDMVNNPSLSSQQLAINITNHQSPGDNSGYRTQCISSIDLSKIQDLVNYVDILSTKLRNNLSLYKNQIQQARNQSDWTMGPSGGQIERIIDLYDFADNIYNLVPDPSIQSVAQNITNLIGPSGGQSGYAVVKERHTPSADFCHGISIYFPNMLSRYDASYTNNNDFTSDTDWDEFLSDFYSVSTPPFMWDSYLLASEINGSQEAFIFGESGSATDGNDGPPLDIQHAPYPPPDLVIYSMMDGTKYAVDTKYGPDTSKIWDVYVEWKGSGSTTVTLTWDVSQIPSDEYASVILYDVESGTSTNMRSESSYGFIINSDETHHFKIICSNKIYITTLTKKAGASYGWNLFGLPFNQSINLGDLEFNYQGTSYTFYEASSQGLIYGVIYDFDRENQQYTFLYQDTDTLNPGYGYWIKVFVQDIELWYLPSGTMNRENNTPRWSSWTANISAFETGGSGETSHVSVTVVEPEPFHSTYTSHILLVSGPYFVSTAYLVPSIIE